MSKKKHLTVMHSEMNVWRSQIELVRDEVKAFKIQLAEILSKNTGHEVAAEAEHFQNQFIRQNEVSDELYHEIKLADHELALKAKDNTSTSHILVDDHTELRDKANTYVRLFNELKAEFHAFEEKAL